MTAAARRRQKRLSLALSAALAAGPVIPEAIAAAESGSGSNAAGKTAANGNDLLSGRRVVLHEGTSGRLVTALQLRLNQVLPLTHLSVDGIFGPQTRGAVLDFQRRKRLAPTGAVDARTWAVLFKAPVLVMDGTSDTAPAGGSTPSVASGSAAAAGPSSTRPSEQGGVGASSDGAAGGSQHNGAGSKRAPIANRGTGRASVPVHAADTKSSVVGGRGNTTSGSSSRGGHGVTVVAPSAAPPQKSTYVLTNGTALPLPRGYLTSGSVDQGVDYAAPGGTPLYAMGNGVIVGAGISGFGPNAPILKITSGALAGTEVYYGHAGRNHVGVGQHVRAGQQISEVGYGIVGISTGPHLEIGFYPPGGMGAGGRMLSVINGLLGQRGVKARVARGHMASMGGSGLRHRSRSSTTRSSVRASRDSADSTHRAHRLTQARRSRNPAPRRRPVRRLIRRTAPSAATTRSTRRPRRTTRSEARGSGRDRD